jgi:TQXA domain-containing protein
MLYMGTEDEATHVTTAFCADYYKDYPSDKEVPYVYCCDLTDPRLLTLVYNGYGENADRLQETFGLTDKEFDDVTQKAIWLVCNKVDKSGTFGSGLDATLKGDCVSFLAGEHGNSATFQYGEKIIEAELATPPKDFVVKLFVPQDKEDQHYQPLVVLPENLEHFPITFTKQDEAGNGVVGASFEIIRGYDDPNGDYVVIDSWTTTSESSTHVSYLEVGSYQLIETSTPDGYTGADVMSFYVDDFGNIYENVQLDANEEHLIDNFTFTGKGEVKEDDDGNVIGTEVAAGEPIVVTNTRTFAPVNFSKQDVSGNELKGATIELRQADGTVVETWISDGTVHTFNAPINMDLKLVETAAPSGYAIATTISFRVEGTIGEDGSVTDYKIIKEGTEMDSDAPIVMVDALQPVVYIAPTTYTISFSKQDTGGNELPGATIQLQTTYGTIIDTWVSDGSVHTFNVTAGSYQLVESAAPEGYELATTISFTVDASGNVTANGTRVDSNAPIVMVDGIAKYAVSFSKEDASGNELPGATIELQTEDGTVIDSWISDGTAHIFNVEPGTYQLVETAAPDGYALATAITFTVDKSGNVTSGGVQVTSDAPITMVDGLADIPEPQEEEEDPVIEPEDPDEPETPDEAEAPDEPEAPAETEEPEALDSPKTGDVTTLWIAIPMSCACLVGIVLVLKKKKNI